MNEKQDGHEAAVPSQQGAKTTDRGTLVDRLRGIYVIPVNDGGGLLNGKDTFTRKFDVSPIQLEAADTLLALQTQLESAQAAIAALSDHGLDLSERLESSRAQLERVERALEELVALKDLKEQFTKRSHFERNLEFTKDYDQRVEYETRQPLAWKAARAALPSAKTEKEELKGELERVERETIERCAEVCQRKVDALSSAENGDVEADTNAFIWTNKEAEWAAIVLEEDVIPAIRALPSAQTTETE